MPLCSPLGCDSGEMLSGRHVTGGLCVGGELERGGTESRLRSVEQAVRSDMSIMSMVENMDYEIVI